MESDAASAARTYLWGQALVFGIGTLVFAGLLLFVPMGDPYRLGVVLVVTGLCGFGFAAGLVALLRSGAAPTSGADVGVLPCKHCGRRFATSRIRDRHERVCPEMRL